MAGRSRPNRQGVSAAPLTYTGTGSSTLDSFHRLRRSRDPNRRFAASTQSPNPAAPPSHIQRRTVSGAGRPGSGRAVWGGWSASAERSRTGAGEGRGSTAGLSATGRRAST